MKTVLARLLGRVVNWFPNHVFYSKDFMPGFRVALGESTDPHRTAGSTAMLGLAISVGRAMKPGDTLTTEFTGVTDRGLNMGDFKITVERLGQMSDKAE